MIRGCNDVIWKPAPQAFRNEETVWLTYACMQDLYQWNAKHVKSSRTRNTDMHARNHNGGRFVLLVYRGLSGCIRYHMLS